MEDPFIEKVSTEELNRISQEAAELQTEYSIQRIIVNRELARRAAMIEIIAPEQEIKSAPIYPPSNPPVHNHGSEEGRGLVRRKNRREQIARLVHGRRYRAKRQ